MTAKGFQLECLQVSGHGKEAATVSFKGGFNVISGPSNTGKSYIYNCLNFMLGGSSPPKAIDAGKGYETAYLVIRPDKHTQFTFERSLSGGAFRMFEGGLDSVGKSEGTIISDEHSATSDDNLSAILLRLCDLRGKTVYQNQGGETRGISFRDVIKLILVNETRIFVEGSPIITETLYWSAEKSTFKLLLTGSDSGGVIVKKASPTAKAQRQGQIQLIGELITQIEIQISELTTDANGVEEQVQKAEAAIQQLTLSLADAQAEIGQHEAVRQESYQTIQQLDSRRIAIHELLSRFDLLRDRYMSDLQRLGSV